MQPIPYQTQDHALNRGTTGGTPGLEVLQELDFFLLADVGADGLRAKSSEAAAHRAAPTSMSNLRSLPT